MNSSESEEFDEQQQEQQEEEQQHEPLSSSSSGTSLSWSTTKSGQVIGEAQKLMRTMNDKYYDYKRDAQCMISKLEEKIQAQHKQLHYCEKENSELCEENARMVHKVRQLAEEQTLMRKQRQNLMNENEQLRGVLQKTEEKVAQYAQSVINKTEFDKLQQALRDKESQLAELKSELATAKSFSKTRLDEIQENKIKPNNKRYSDNFDCSFDLRAFNSEILKEETFTEQDSMLLHSTNYFIEKFEDKSSSLFVATSEENDLRLKSIQEFMNMIYKMKNEYELLKTDWSSYMNNESSSDVNNNNNQLNFTYFDNQFKTILEALFCVLLEENGQQVPSLNKILRLAPVKSKKTVSSGGGGCFGVKAIKSSLKKRARMGGKTSRSSHVIESSYSLLSKPPQLKSLDDDVDDAQGNSIQLWKVKLLSNKKLVRMIKWLDHSDLAITLLFLLSVYVFDVRHIQHLFGTLYESVQTSYIGEAKLPY